MTKEEVNHPEHYGGDVPHETYKCLRAWGLESDALLWNAAKYISRAGKKEKENKIQDLKKAIWYLKCRIAELDPTTIAELDPTTDLEVGLSFAEIALIATAFVSPVTYEDMTSARYENYWIRDETTKVWHFFKDTYENALCGHTRISSSSITSKDKPSIECRICESCRDKANTLTLKSQEKK